MDILPACGDDGLPLIADALDTVKAARGQLGTLSHMSEGLEHSVTGLRRTLEAVAAFLSQRRNVALTATSIISVFALLNHLRGWASARSLRRRR